MLCIGRKKERRIYEYNIANNGTQEGPVKELRLKPSLCRYGKTKKRLNEKLTRIGRQSHQTSYGGVSICAV